MDVLIEEGDDGFFGFIGDVREEGNSSERARLVVRQYDFVGDICFSDEGLRGTSGKGEVPHSECRELYCERRHVS